MKQLIITIGLMAMLIYMVGMTFDSALTRQEESECQVWAMQNEQYADFYYLDWQLKQCEL